MARHRGRLAPYKRRNPSGKTVWVARAVNPNGETMYPGTFALRGPCVQRGRTDCCAQHATDAMYDAWDAGAPARPETVGAYASTWTKLHPRSERTNATNQHRIERVLDVEIEGMPLRGYRFDEIRRRHALALVDHLLGEGRARTGVKGILTVLSAMAGDAIDDEIAEVNVFKGVKIRGNDPRIQKLSRRVRIFTREELLAFVAAAGAPARLRGGSTRSEEPKRAGGPEYDPMAMALVRTFRDTGMRLQEVLPLRRADLDRRKGVFHVQRTAHEGKIEIGTKRDKMRNLEEPEGRIVPCPKGLLEVIDATPRRIDTPLLFPTPSGQMWRQRNFYRDIWYPTQRAAGIDPRPHELRHSWLSYLMGKPGVNFPDLADMGGNDLQTMIEHYAHATNRSLDEVRRLLA